MTEELYKKYRPKSFKSLRGQDSVVEMLNEYGRRKSIPHAILLAGPSGCGKTTIARIVKDKLKCGDIDYAELNCANFRGIDLVREIDSRISLAPLQGKCRVWTIDEAHQLTSAAQDAFLKILEDTPAHAYFMLATTDPQKLKPTIRTRCTLFKLASLSSEDLEKIIRDVSKAEEVELTDDVVEKIVDLSEGSARKALVYLDSVLFLEDESAQLAALADADAKIPAFAIVQELSKPKPSWKKLAKILESVAEEPERIRHLVLVCARKSLLRGGPGASRAYLIIRAFGDPFYESKEAGLAAACWEVVSG